MRALGLLLSALLIASAAMSLSPAGSRPSTSTIVAPPPHLMPPDPASGRWPESVALGTPPPPPPAIATGRVDVLVLLIEFTNVSHNASHDAAYFDAFFNAAAAGATSVRAYYAEASYGALTVNATIVPTWFTSNRTMEYYGQDGAVGIDNAKGPIYALVTEAVRAADPVVDFSSFDADADGYVDHLIVVHAGPGQENHANLTDLIWSHSWAVLDADPVVGGIQPLLADNVQVSAYTMVSEASPLGVVAHEFGHGLGLPDLYDTDRSSDGAGIWDIMAEGAWNGMPRGSTPAGLSAWSKIRLGWLTPTDAPGRFVGATIPAIETTPFAYRLPVPELSFEYFLLENREPIGFDVGLPTSGLLIWHVDDSMVTNANDAHRLLDLIEADEGVNGDHPTDGGDPWHDTAAGWGPDTPPGSNAYDGTATRWRVRDISAQGPTIVVTILRDVVLDLAVSEIRVPSMIPVGSSVTANITIVNEGAVSAPVALATRVYRNRIEPADLVLEENTSGFSISGGATAHVNVTFAATALARYLIDATVSLPGDEIGSNDERVAHVSTNVFAFVDDMEGGGGAWTTNGTPQDTRRWTIVNASDPNGSAHSGARAWRFGAFPTATPNPSPPAWHTLTSPIVSVSGPTFLTFYQRYDLSGRAAPPGGSGENGTDRADVEVRYDGGSWTTVAEFRWRHLEWSGVSINVTPPSGATTIQVRFNVTSATMPTTGGWWIDDVALALRSLAHAVVVVPTAIAQEATVGSALAVDFKVVNVGDYKETFWVNASGPAGWITGLLPPGVGLPVAANQTLVLAPDRDASFTIIVGVPFDAAEGRTYVAQVTATAALDGNATSSTALTVDVRASGMGGFVLVIAIAAGLAVVPFAVGFLLRRRRSRVPPN